MADNLFRVNRGISLAPQASVPSSPVNGDIYYDSAQNTFVLYDNGSWINLASQIDVPSAVTLDSVNFTPVVVQNSMARITGSTASNMYGMTASTGGKQIVVYNVSSATTTIFNNDATEPTAANRILTPTGTPFLLTSGAASLLVYDNSQQRWIMLTGSGSSPTPTSAGFAQEVGLTISTTSKVITFPSPLTNTNYIVNVTMVNQTDTNPQFQPMDVTNKTVNGFTVSWNYPLDTANYAVDYVVPQIQSQIAEVGITNGATSLSVTLPIAFANTNYVISGTIIDQTDANPQFQTIAITTKTATGFTAKWNTPVDTANYALAYIAAGYQ